MERLVFKVLELFKDLRPSLSRPQAATAGENAGGDRHRDVWQGATTKGSGGKRRVGSSVRQKLDDLSSCRIRPTAIECASGVSHKSGGKADVARATYRPGNGGDEQVVAVKKLRNTKGNKFENEFVHEVEMMARLSHKNIIQLIGFVEDLESGTAWVVLSWLPNGNVSEFLAKGKWEIPERVSLIKDTFEGIKYLHTRQPPICHGDLKSLNILVSSDYRAVITDFGSARAITTPEDEGIAEQSRPRAEALSNSEQACPPIHVSAAGNDLTLTGPAWSLRWAAPEVMNGQRQGLASDIWAAGWVCWEMMTNQVPFPELNAAGVITLTVIQGSVPSPREERQLGQIVALCSLMTDCWAFDPRTRPDIVRCCNELKWMPSTPPSDANPSESKELSTDLLRKMGEMNYKQDNYEKAALLFQQALSLAVSTGNQEATADALNWLGDVYNAQCKYNEAEESYTRGQEIYARIGSDRGRVSTLRGLGELYRSQSKYTKAEEVYTQAQKIYARIGDDLGQANAFDGLGEVYVGRSKYTEAEESYTRAYEIHARIGNDRGRANTLRGLGEVYRSQKKYTEAEESFNRAQEIYARIGDDLGQACALDGRGEVYSAQSKYTEAEESFNRAHGIHARIGNDLGRANVLLGLGDAYCEQSKYTEAENSYTRAQEIYARLGSDLGRANTLYGIGHLRRKQGRKAEAASHYTWARDLYAEIGVTEDFEGCSRWLLEVSSDGDSFSAPPQESSHSTAPPTNLSQ